MKRLTDKRFLGDGFYQPKNTMERKEIQMMKKPSYDELYQALGKYENEAERNSVVVIEMENGAVGSVYSSDKSMKVLIVDDNCCDKRDEILYEASEKLLDEMLEKKQVYPIGYLEIELPEDKCGHWKEVYQNGESSVYECSKCKHLTFHISNHCVCGAYMEGVSST